MLRGSGNEPQKQTDPDKMHYITGTQAQLYMSLFLEIRSEPHPSMGPKVALCPWSSRFYCACVERRRMLRPHSAASPAVSSSFSPEIRGQARSQCCPPAAAAAGHDLQVTFRKHRSLPLAQGPTDYMTSPQDHRRGLQKG